MPERGSIDAAPRLASLLAPRCGVHGSHPVAIAGLHAAIGRVPGPEPDGEPASPASCKTESGRLFCLSHGEATHTRQPARNSSEQVRRRESLTMPLRHAARSAPGMVQPSRTPMACWMQREEAA